MSVPTHKKEKIRKLLKDEKLSQRKIARLTGVSLHTVRNQAIAHGLRDKGTPRITKKQEELVRYMLETSGVTMTKIAEMSGVSYNTVRRTKQELNAPIGRNRKIKDIIEKVSSLNKENTRRAEKNLTPDETKKALELLENSNDYAKDIAHKMNISYDCLKRSVYAEKGEDYLSRRKQKIEEQKISPELVKKVIEISQSSEVTFKELARKYGVPYTTLMDRVSKELKKKPIAVMLDKDGRYIGVTHESNVKVRVFLEVPEKVET